MKTKYWVSLSVVLVIGFAAWSYYDFNHNSVFTQKTIDQKCLDVLNQFMSNHPNNIHCEIINDQYFHGTDQENLVYVYTGADGSKLTIDPQNKTVTLVDKNGAALPLPIK